MEVSQVIIDLILVFMEWFEHWFLISKLERAERLAYKTWCKKHTRIAGIKRAGEEYWKKYPIPY